MSLRTPPTRYVIIGDGAAGFTAVAYIRQKDSVGSIQVVSNDSNSAYFRAALTNYLIGDLREPQLFAVPPDFYAVHAVERIEDSVKSIDPSRRRLTFASGRPPLPYDRLLIATGASARPPPFPARSQAGGTLSDGQPAGVMTLRTLQDARRVLEAIDRDEVDHAVVVGGGTLGLELVQAFHARRVAVSYLLGGRSVCGDLLDKVCSDLVLSRLEAADKVTVYRDQEIAEACADGRGRLCQVRLKPGGAVLPCDIAVVAIGVQPNVALVSELGIATQHGIPVNHNLCTQLPDVYAAGDVAALWDKRRGAYRSLGLWEPARQQGRVAGINMAGGLEGGAAVYRPGAIYHATRLWDLDLAAVGETLEQPGDEVLPHFPRGTGQIDYRKLVLRGGRLVGALLLGERQTRVRHAGRQYKRLIDAGIDLGRARHSLLDPDFDASIWLDPDHFARRSHAVAAPPSHTLSRPLASEVHRPAAPGATLTRLSDDHVLAITGALRIGRARDTNDEPIDDARVSSHHAIVEWCEAGYVVRDLGSRNGTYVNQSRVTGARTLQAGDLVDFYRSRYRFDVVAVPQDNAVPQDGSAAVAPPAPSAATPVLPAHLAGQPGAGHGAEIPDAAIEQAGRRKVLTAPEIRLGRDPRTVIPIDDPQVSWRHAQISLYQGAFYLRDLGSTNGTYVNDSLVTTPHRLSDGDLVRLGPRSAFVFRGGGQAGKPQADKAVVAPTPPAQAPGAGAPAAAGACPICGRAARAGARFCAACGAPLDAAAGGGPP